MAAKVAALKEAVRSGKDIINDLGGVYDAALGFYGRFDGAREFKDRYRSLELTIANATKYNLEFDSEYFDSGTWFISPEPLTIKPGEVALALVANRAGSVLCGVTGGVKYRIVGTNKCLYLGFTNPATGSYKNFIDVTSGGQSAQWAYDNSQDDSVKQKQNAAGFRLTCTMKRPKMSSYKNFQYTIEDV